jgi:DNA-binding NarL/FixJ family response regulator
MSGTVGHPLIHGYDSVLNTLQTCLPRTTRSKRSADALQEGLIIDDHPIVREGIRELLQKAFPSFRLSTSSGANGVMEEVCGRRWAFVVLDIHLSGHNGLDIVKKAKTCCPAVPILIFSLFAAEQYAHRALQAGAVGYVSKDRSPWDLVEAVRSALRQQTVTRSDVRPNLSDREIQVLSLLAKGLSRQDISRSLDINEKTVSTYKTRLLQKLGLRNLVDLLRYAVDVHLNG